MSKKTDEMFVKRIFNQKYKLWHQVAINAVYREALETVAKGTGTSARTANEALGYIGMLEGQEDLPFEEPEVSRAGIRIENTGDGTLKILPEGDGMVADEDDALGATIDKPTPRPPA